MRNLQSQNLREAEGKSNSFYVHNIRETTRLDLKFVKEKCYGDFCNFVEIDSGLLSERSNRSRGSINILDRKNSVPEGMISFVSSDVIGKLPYQIPYQLVNRVKQDPEEIKAILAKHKIYPDYMVI